MSETTAAAVADDVETVNLPPTAESLAPLGRSELFALAEERGLDPKKRATVAELTALLLDEGTDDEVADDPAETRAMTDVVCSLQLPLADQPATTYVPRKVEIKLQDNERQVMQRLMFGLQHQGIKCRNVPDAVRWLIAQVSTTAGDAVAS